MDTRATGPPTRPERPTWRRWRLRIRAVFALYLLIGLVSIAGATRVIYRETVPEGRLSTACVPYERPTTVAELNRLIATFRSAPGFLGADVGANVRLQDGRSLWAFGDTLRASGYDDERFVRNSLLIFGDRCASVVEPPDRGAVLPDREDGVGYWPMSMTVVHERYYDTVGVTAQRVRTTGKGAFDFENLGPAFALFRVRFGKAPRLVAMQDLGPDSADTTQPVWGAAVATDRKWAYVFGTANPRRELIFGWSLRVARVPLKQATDQNAWRYWDGQRWQPDAQRAQVLIDAEGGVSQVLSVFRRGSSWYAVSKRDEFVGTDLVIWKAPRPTGPFVPSRPLAKIPSNRGRLRYMPLAHPDLFNEDPSTIVVSYSRNVADLVRVARNPTLYRPEFLEVPLP